MDALFKARKKRRANPTPAEAAFANALNARAIDFRREQPLPGGFFADFYFREPLLVVEVDGPSHLEMETRERDERKDAACVKRGYVVMRVSNDEVLRDAASVAERIALLIESRGVRARWQRSTPPRLGLPPLRTRG